MTALEYMKRQAESNRMKLNLSMKKKGVNAQELENIRMKIGFYEEAAKALEERQA